MSARPSVHAEAVLRALDAMEVIVATPDRREAGAHARSMLAGLDEETLRHAAAFLADAAVWALGRVGKPVLAVRFIERQRLEASALLPEVQR